MRFLQDITLGLYLPGDSAVHRLDPRAKLALCGLLMAAAFYPGRAAVVAGCVLPALALGVGLARVPPGMLLRGLRPFRWLFGFTVLLHALTTPGRELLVLPWLAVPVTWEGLVAGAGVSAQLAAAIAVSSLLTLTTSPTDLVWGMERLGAPLNRLGVPVGEFCVSVLLAIRFFPILQQEAEHLRLALLSRGADYTTGSLRRRVRGMAPLLALLFRRVFERAEKLALAMELRGFVPGEPHKTWRRHRFAAAEWGAMMVGVATLGAAATVHGLGWA